MTFHPALVHLAFLSLGQPIRDLQTASLPGTLTRIDKTWWPKIHICKVSNDGNNLLFDYNPAGGVRIKPSYALPPHSFRTSLPESPYTVTTSRFSWYYSFTTNGLAGLIGGGRMMLKGVDSAGRALPPGAQTWFPIRALDPVADPGPVVYFQLSGRWTLVDGDWDDEKHRLWLRIGEIKDGRIDIVDKTWSVPGPESEAATAAAVPLSTKRLGLSIKADPVHTQISPDGQQALILVLVDPKSLTNESYGRFLVDMKSGRRMRVDPGLEGNYEFAFLGGKLYAYCSYAGGRDPGWGIKRWDGDHWTQASSLKLLTASMNGRYALLSEQIADGPDSKDAVYLWKPEG